MRKRVKIYKPSDYVFFGPRLEHTEWNELFSEHGVSVVMNLQREDVDNFQVSPLFYTWMPSKDAALPAETMLIGALFLTSCVEQDLTVYVHCRAGVNRAPQMAVAYLMDQGLSIDNAISAVKRVRPKFNPNERVLMAFDVLKSLL